MKFIFLVLFLFVGLTTFSYSEEKLKVIAVGNAELEKQKIAVLKSDLSKLSDVEKKSFNELVELIISDFDLYRHLFDVEKKTILQDAKKGYHYLIDLDITIENKEVFLSVKLVDQISGKEKSSVKKKVWFNNIRSFGHEISNTLYKAITGVDSIFKTKILFVSDRTSIKKDLRKELYIMDFDGKRKQRLTYLNSLVISPALSPDNQKASFSVIGSKWKKRASGKGVHKVKNINLYEMNLRSRKQKLVSSLDGINSGAVYDVKGENLYLTLSSLKNADIYKMNLKTKALKRVTSHFSDDVDPHINADESLMTFLSGRAGKAMIYTLDPRGTEKKVKRISFVGKFNAAPRFSPDGSEIVFASWVDNLFDLYKIGSDGRNLVRLTKNFGSNEEAWFSPDGQFIVFTSQRVLSKTKAVQNIYIMNREGEILKQLTSNYGKCYTPRWSN